MIFQFLRLTKLKSNEEVIEFRCELPGGEADDADTWLDCGRITARSAAGLLSELALDLNQEFFNQVDGEDYAVAELIEAVVLWVGWESRWIADDIITVELNDPAHHEIFNFMPETKEIGAFTTNG